MSLASGSSGNCYYVGTEDFGFLIDAGLTYRMIEKRLGDAGISMESLRAVLITHDHADHVSGLGKVGGKLCLPIYATDGVRRGILKRKDRQALSANFRVVRKNEPFALGAFSVEAFDVPHDGTDNVGYLIGFGDLSLCIVTDLGRVTKAVEHYAGQANYLVLESNHDKDMLRHGAYPWLLKSRISGRYGHLSNKDAADLVARIVSPKLKQIWLCHLSQDNNKPELAVQVVRSALYQQGYDELSVHVSALPRTQSTPLYCLE